MFNHKKIQNDLHRIDICRYLTQNLSTGKLAIEFQLFELHLHCTAKNKMTGGIGLPNPSLLPSDYM